MENNNTTAGDTVNFQDDILNFKARLERLEAMVLEMHQVLHLTARRTKETENAVQKLAQISMEGVIDIVERAIAAYRSNLQLDKELNTLLDKQQKVYLGSR